VIWPSQRQLTVVNFVDLPYNWFVLRDDHMHEDWRLADQAAALLRVDRDACRRAFHREPARRVRAGVRWVLSERHLPDHDPELMLEEWARRHGAGVYGQGRRNGELEHVEGIAITAVFRRAAVA
jgi:hypothetical protein